jgi:hypothetical protein
MKPITALRSIIRDHIKTADEKTLWKVLKILEKEGGGDIDWDELPEELQKIIDEGIKQGDEDRGIPHEEIVKMYPQWFKK